MRDNQPDSLTCPHCGNSGKIYDLKGKTPQQNLKKCSKCRKEFTEKIGTIAEGSKLPVSVWVSAISVIGQQKGNPPKRKIVTQLVSELKISRPTATRIYNKIERQLLLFEVEDALEELVEQGRITKVPGCCYDIIP